MKKKAIAFGMSVALSASAGAQLTGPQTPARCLDLRGGGPGLSAEGRLSVRHFAGPPHYESIAAGDAVRRVFVLELPAAACIDDGGEFADSSERFAIVHLTSGDERVLAALRGALGRRISVTGEGFASNNGLHHAPLVLMVASVTVR